ncbi:hypothetical protein [Streptomyces sp. NPDC057939]|uniref:hypothetical protein n=1 Tax=Streptomyces sp. NPDC057939 TaxID=3346284 RepID=UPI0036E557A7
MAQDTPSAPEPMVAYDHTDLLNRPKRIWNWGNIPLPGLLLPALGAALGFGVIWLVALLSLSAFLPFLGLSIVTSVLYIGPPVGIYFIWGRPLPSALTLSQQLVVWADFWLQPKRLQGLSADREPEVLHWQVVLWQPGSQRWQRQYAEALATAARHGSSFAATPDENALRAGRAAVHPQNTHSAHSAHAHSETAG